MQNIKQNKCHESTKIEGSKHAQTGFNELHNAGLVCLSVCLLCLSGCSGFGTDSLSGDPLSSRPILPPEVPSAVPTESNPNVAPDAAINQLAQIVGTTAKQSTEAFNDDTTPSESQEITTPTFQFSTDLPAEPEFSNAFPAAELAPPVVDHALAEFDNNSTNLTQTVVNLVATTQPVEAALEAEPIATFTAPPRVQPDFFSQPLKPIAPPVAAPEPAPAPEVKIAVGMPPLSVADLQQLTQLAVETPSLSSSQSVDLSELELESNLTRKPPAPEPQPVKKPLTATEHLSETIRLIEATIPDASVPGEHHGAGPGVQLLEILRQKMDQVSSADWRLSTTEHQYWQQQLQAVSVMFESDSTTSLDSENQTGRQTAARAIKHLERAASHLRSMAGLKLSGGQLCSQILGFGKFEELESNRFQPGDRALIYVEVENQAAQKILDEPASSSEDEPTWLTRLQTGYVIRDWAGNIVHQETYPVIEDLARRHRRDFYLHLPVTIGELSPGDYQLSVSVDDLGDSRESGNVDTATLPAIDFSIIQATN